MNVSFRCRSSTGVRLGVMTLHVCIAAFLVIMDARLDALLREPLAMWVLVGLVVTLVLVAPILRPRSAGESEHRSGTF